MTVATGVPTVEELREYLARRKPLGRDWDVETMAPLNDRLGANHWSFVAKAHGQDTVLRMLNPASVAAASRWLSVNQEFRLLFELYRFDELVARPYGLDPGGFRLPILFQEYVPGVALAELRERGMLDEAHLRAAANLIALLGECGIRRWRFPVLWVRTERSYRQHVRRCRARLAEVAEATSRTVDQHRRELSHWYDRLANIIEPVATILGQYQAELSAAPSVLIFKGSHLGNTLWEEQRQRCRFVDFEAAAWGDPVFTLARFLMDLKGKGGAWDQPAVRFVAQTYWRAQLREVPYFGELLAARLLERELSDAVWVLWKYARDLPDQSVTHATSIQPRFERLQELTRTWPEPVRSSIVS